MVGGILVPVRDAETSLSPWVVVVVVVVGEWVGG